MNTDVRPHTPPGTAITAGQVLGAVPDAVRRLDPRSAVRRPVMFVVWVASVLVTVLVALAPNVFGVLVTAWLWLTVFFANLAEAVAERRGRAQADAMRRSRTETVARRVSPDVEEVPPAGSGDRVPAGDLVPGDLVVVGPGEVVPGDGEILSGLASVDESAITGESTPVVREAGGDRSSVTGGTTVLSDSLLVRITAAPGQSVVDRMIRLVEGARRQPTPNEVAITVLLATLSVLLVAAVTALQPIAAYSGARQPVLVLVALAVCLLPTTVGALLPAVGIAGMNRLVRRNVLATSGRAVEAAGDVATLLLDKTGTITFGNRMATELVPVDGVGVERLAAAARLASLADPTPEGRSVVELCAREHGLSADTTSDERAAVRVPFTARTRMSGLDLPSGAVDQPVLIRKGAAAEVVQWVRDRGGHPPAGLPGIVDAVARQGGTPLVCARAEGGHAEILGVVRLADVVKPHMPARFAELRRMGVRTVMITGDNPVTAAAIAEQAGVDDHLAEATPEDKMRLIREERRGGRLVAMAGDGTNDAPALAAADVGLAMNSGTTAAKEAGNLVDLDSDPSKLIAVIGVGKQLLITRGALTTFSIANDLAKYFAILPAMFTAVHPGLGALNVMGLASANSAVLSAVVFNALVIVALIPLALHGVRYRPLGAATLLRRNLLLFGVGGLVAPFLGIWALDLAVRHLPGLG
ncbi:potassium-transporting ATPase subunit KdpB [Actinoalloteichus caeruleus]|uniref:Potassium-transporting ATPase ATP-binding subunit n=2 Tax=Actinoalloteichus cyanogriseus TaxID=2893586 RepID=A0ABT1JHN0_ACTCY|nr:potassium-transporting ATPase subunit KdpB [Actinoalloteichus caeruleus]MCP2332020.1 K+-transporting ATPase ATPase B chain [Actinoalloteichus caeruleus DSM 43889]